MSRASQSLPINDMYRTMYLMPAGSARYLNNDRQSLSGSGILRLIPRELPRFSSQPTGYAGHPAPVSHDNLGHALPYPMPCQPVPLVSPCKDFKIFQDVHEYEQQEFDVEFVDHFKIINDKHAERKDDTPMNFPRFSTQPTCYFHPDRICHGNLGHAIPYPIPCHSVPLASPKMAFEICLDVHEYKPEELKVKCVDDFIIIDGKHTERKGDVILVSQKFTRRCEIPKDIDKESINCFLSLDGILSIFGQKVLKERKIPIIIVNQTSTSRNAEVVKRKSVQGKKDQSQRREAPQDSTKTMTVKESVSPQSVEVPETMEQNKPEQSTN